MNGEIRRTLIMTPQTPNYVALDSRGLDLDEQPNVRWNGFDDFVEGRHRMVTIEADFAKAVSGDRSNRSGTTRPGDGKIVMNEHHAVCAGMHVELDTLCAGFNGGGESRDGILRR